MNRGGDRPPFAQIHRAIAEDLRRADRHQSRPQIAVPFGTESRTGPSTEIEIIFGRH